jgi:hypothetical protein
VTTTATVTARAIVTAALRKIGVVAADEPASGDAITEGIAALNRLLKSLQNRGVNLWATSAQTVTLTTAAAQTLDPVRPMQILSCRFKRNGVEMPMIEMTRGEYDRLPVKTTQGTPTQFYYDRQRAAAVLYIWPVLATAAGETLEITYTRELEDETADAQVDVPSEWYDAIVYGLADRLADDYGVNAPKVTMRAEREINTALAFDREGSVFFAGPNA